MKLNTLNYRPYYNYLVEGNNKLKGTILYIQKNVRHSYTKDPAYTIIIYFSHETGRIERYLFNYNSEFYVRMLDDMRLKGNFNSRDYIELIKKSNLTLTILIL